MVKTRVIQTRLVPNNNIVAITLFGLVFTRCRERVDKYVLNHELIHCQQQLELGYVLFFVIYLIEWVCLMLKYRDWDMAYRNISFEREAYANAHDLNYLKHRKLYQSFRHRE